MTREEITALFERYRDSWARHDAAALAACHAEDGVVESPWAGTVTGRHAIEQTYHAWFTAFPDSTFETRDLLIDDDRVAWLWELAGTDTGGFMGLSPSGKRFQFQVVRMCTLRDGRIVRDRRIYDFTGLLIQVGILKARPV